MPVVNQERVLARYRADALNSSHFVWLLAGLDFFESSADHWIFAYRRLGRVTLFALEPLIPGAPRQYHPEHAAAFDRAWAELCESLRPDLCAFVGIYSPFRAMLAERAGFSDIRVGREPWVDLEVGVPRGNAGKGVRAARNQAIGAGVRVEQWDGRALAGHPERRRAISKLFAGWKGKRAIQLGGFLNSADPFAHAEDRRYFVALRADRSPDGYLVATPVAGQRGYFLEDLILDPLAPRGTGELLTVEALTRLGESGYEMASLGVVPGTSVEVRAGSAVPGPIRLLVDGLPALLQRIYNFDGLETFRKRFKPSRWDDVHLSVLDRARADGGAGSRAWVSVLLALGRAFEPRARPGLGPLRAFLVRHLRRHAASTALLGIMVTLFAVYNHGGALPASALASFGFSANLPARLWLLRSLTSDFFYFDARHFAVVVSLYWIVLRWAERSHRPRFIFGFLACMILLDDIVNYFALVVPFAYLDPALFQRLIRHEDVGGSLGLMAFVGLQICQLRRGRELTLAAAAVAVVLGQAFASRHHQTLLLNLNHFLFLMIGFVVGKLKFEAERRASRLASKGKPPSAQSGR